MKPYYDQDGIVIYHGDCLAVLPALEAGSISAIVTDPPYGLGFMGKHWDHGVPGVAFWTEALRVLKPGGHLLAFGGTRTYHRLACAIEDSGFEIRDCLAWMYGSGFPKSLNVQQAMNKAAAGHPQGGADPTSPNAGKFKGGCSDDNPRGRGFGAGAGAFMAEQGSARGGDDGPWNGWGTALKPAYEPIVLARKPLAGTVAANVQEHGTGAINVDGCRIGTDEITTTNGKGFASSFGGGVNDNGGSVRVGRWPANVVLDEEAARVLDEQSGESAPKPGRVGAKGGNRGALGEFSGSTPEAVGTWHEDPGGGASRFFYTAKASRAERNGEAGGANNNHPTVKPVDLMRWCVRLVTPPGGIVLDPFMGSGTTLVAARDEHFHAIGVELEAEYCEIAAKRLAQGVLPFGEA